MAGDRVYPYPKSAEHSSPALHIACPSPHFSRWVWTTTGGWWVQPRHWRRNFAVAVVGVAGLAVSLYAYSDARESYTDFATQSVWYSSLDQRKRWIKREEKARKLKELNYSKELGQRPTYDQ